MLTLGFPPSYSDAVTVGSLFQIDGLTFVAAYVYVSVAGDIVWENNQGQANWFPGAPQGFVILGARRILSSATVNGSSRTTTATVSTWLAVNQLFNTP